jgi:hypothetical protein
VGEAAGTQRRLTQRGSRSLAAQSLSLNRPTLLPARADDVIDRTGVAVGNINPWIERVFTFADERQYPGWVANLGVAAVAALAAFIVIAVNSFLWVGRAALSSSRIRTSAWSIGILLMFIVGTNLIVGIDLPSQ